MAEHSILYQIKALMSLQPPCPNKLSWPYHSFKDKEVQRFRLPPLKPPFPTKCSSTQASNIYFIPADFISYTIGSLSF